jgi:hypothetical protein
MIGALKMKRPLGAGLAMLVAWMVIDVLMHRLFLAPIYEASAVLWRPLDQLNIALIYGVTFALIGVFVSIYWLLVRPKSLGTGIAMGALVGLALGISSGFGTFIHMPIPLSLAWGWFIGGWLKGLVAGGIVGAMIGEI